MGKFCVFLVRLKKPHAKDPRNLPPSQTGAGHLAGFIGAGAAHRRRTDAAQLPGLGGCSSGIRKA